MRCFRKAGIGDSQGRESGLLAGFPGKWFAALSSRSQGSRPQQRKRRLSCETLESRQLLSIGSATTLLPASNAAVYGQAVALTAQVTSLLPDSGTPTGTVDLKEGDAVLATQALAADGTAVFDVSPVTVGTHMLTAAYHTDSDTFSDSSSDAAEVDVAQASTTTNLAISQPSSVYGDSLTFTATVGVVLPGSGTPTGTVSFMEGTTVLDTETLAADGTAVFQTTSLAVGTHSIAAVYGGDANFLGSAADSVEADITAKTLTFSGLSANNKVYDGTTAATFDSSGAVLSGVVNGDSVSLSGGTASFADKDVGAGKTVTVTGLGLSGDGAGNYVLDTDAASLTADITKATLTVTADDASRTYGDANPTFTATISGFVNDEDLSTSGVTGNADLSTTADQSSDVGAYTITASLGGLAAGNYDFSFADGTLTVNKATLTVTADTPTKTYGDEIVDFTGSLVGLKNNDDITIATFASDGTAATAVVGDYAITASLNDPGGKLDNYDLVYGTLTVDKATLTLAADNQTKTYGDEFSAFTGGGLSGLVNGDDITIANLTSAGAGAEAGAGEYAITAVLSDPDGKLSNYNVSYTGVLTVTPAVLTVTANNVSRDYGTPNPTFNVSYSGFKNGENAATAGLSGNASLTTTANELSTVGDYTINAGAGTLAAANYTFAFVNGTLAVAPATLTVLVDSVTKTYGDEITDYFGVIWSGLRNNDNITIASLASDGGAATASVGVYGFTATFNDPDGKLSNYNVVYDGTLTVEKATLTVTADDQTKTYGDSAADFTGSLGELKNNDNITVTGFSSAAPRPVRPWATMTSSAR